MSRERNEQGQFVGADDETVLDAVREAGHIATARDVAGVLDSTREAAYQRLAALHDRGVVERRKVGGRAVVWWVADEGEGATIDEEIDSDDPLFGGDAIMSVNMGDESIDDVLYGAVESGDSEQSRGT